MSDCVVEMTMNYKNYGLPTRVLKGLRVYVDVKSSFGQSAVAIGSHLRSMGAELVQSLGPSVTHVVFRNGEDVTKTWAAKHRVFLIAPAWVQACYTENRRVPEPTYAVREKQDIDSAVADPAAPGTLLTVKPLNGLVTPVVSSTVFAAPIDAPPLPVPTAVGKFIERLQNRKKTRISNVHLFSDSDSSMSDGDSTPDKPTDGKPLSGLPICKTSVYCDPSIRKENMAPHQEPDVLSNLPKNNPENVRRITCLNTRQNDIITPISKKPDAKCPNTNIASIRRKRISFGAPLTPQVLIDMVTSARTPKSQRNLPKCATSLSNKKRVPMKKVYRSTSRRNRQKPLRNAHKNSRNMPPALQNSLFKISHSTPSENPIVSPQKKITRQVSDNVSVPIVQNNPVSINCQNKSSKSYYPPAASKSNQCKDTKPVVLMRECHVGLNGSTVETVKNKRTKTPKPCPKTVKKRFSLENHSIEHRKPVDETIQKSQPVAGPRRSLRIATLDTRNSLDDFSVRHLHRLKRSTADSKREDVNFADKKCSISFTGLKRGEEQMLLTLLTTSDLNGYTVSSADDHDDSGTAAGGVLPWRVTGDPSGSQSSSTYLVTVTPYRRTLKLLQGLLSGVHIVSVDWLKESARLGVWMDAVDFRPKGLPRHSRVKALRRLFANFDSVFLAKKTRPPREALAQLLTLGGAQLTNRVSCARLVIGCSHPEAVCVKPIWIIDCIMQAKLLSTRHYTFVD